MSIKAQLMARVARCAPMETQHATFARVDATAGATDPQQLPANPCESKDSDATASATRAQLKAKQAATFLPSCALRLPRDATRNFCTDAELIDAAMRACDFWRDSPQAREAMRRECMATPEHQRADLLAHFLTAYGGAVVDSGGDAAAGQQPRGP